MVKLCEGDGEGMRKMVKLCEGDGEGMRKMVRLCEGMRKMVSCVRVMVRV